MGLFLQQTEGGLQWAVWKVEESVEELLALFPADGQQLYAQEIAGFASDKRKLEKLAVRALLYTVLGEVKSIAYEASGRPYLEDRSYHISFSHTKGYVAVIWHPTLRVGVDIEQYSTRVQRIASRFMREDEVPAAYEGDTTWSLLLHWSVKESVYKCMLHPDADFRRLQVEPLTLQSQGQFRVKEWSTQSQHVFQAGYHLHTDFVLTWVWSEGMN